MPKKTPDDAEALMSAIGLLLRRVKAQTDSHDLSMTERLVVARLASGGPASIADLARAEGMKPQSMGATVAALEAAGIVAREPHPTDGRQSLIGLSQHGVAVRKTIRDAKRAWLQQALARLEPHERETLFAAGRIMARLVAS